MLAPALMRYSTSRLPQSRPGLGPVVRPHGLLDAWCAKSPPKSDELSQVWNRGNTAPGTTEGVRGDSWVRKHSPKGQVGDAVPDHRIRVGKSAPGWSGT